MMNDGKDGKDGNRSHFQNVVLYRAIVLLSHQALLLNCIESLHLLVCSVAPAVLRTVIKETHCIWSN